ncbi:MAG: hypothetical protein HZA17_09540 [Nitrospirae bacterium]|nr:hypothetical protein [Nitrospirota bacterium]
MSIQLALRLFLLFILIAAVLLEGYYILALQSTIEKQSEELNNISIQLQSLKHERTSLNEELSSLKKSAEEDNHGNTTER